MSWIYRQRKIWRLAALAFLVIAFFGPWVYEALITDAPIGGPCPGSLVLLRSGRCAIRLSGLRLLSLFGFGIIGMIGAPRDEITSIRAREFLFGAAITLLPAPVLTLTILLAGGDGRLRRIIHLLGLGLVLLPTLLLIVVDPNLWSLNFWGIWLFTVTAAASLLLELLSLRHQRRAIGFGPADGLSVL